MSKILKNITWKVNKDGDIILVDKKGGDTDHLLHVWSGSVRKNITIKTLAKQVLNGDNVTLMITRGGKKAKHGGTAYELGPIVNVRRQLAWQRVIVEPEAYVA
jgi:hypothetical protein